MIPIGQPPPAIVLKVEEIDRSRMLDAIAEEETGHDPERVGLSGERSEWQIKRFVWRKWTDLDFETCASTKFARGVALQHLEWLLLQLRSHNVSMTPENVGACWLRGAQGGMLAIKRGHLPGAAARIGNLYRDSASKAPRRIRP